ncbi:MAG: hypothetical protein Q9228_005963 [Teloschistes exilis]
MLAGIEQGMLLINKCDHATVERITEVVSCGSGKSPNTTSSHEKPALRNDESQASRLWKGASTRPSVIPAQYPMKVPITTPGTRDNYSTAPTTSRSTVLKRQFPISNSKSSFEAKVSPEKRLKPTRSTVARIRSTPKATYHEFLALDQAGEAHIANDNAASCNLVAIKTFEWSRGIRVDCYEELRYDNIVNMIDIFVKDRQICMVYEQMDISLRLMNGLPGGEWEPFDIAAIYKEVCIRNR